METNLKPETESVERIRLLKVPLDIVQAETLKELLETMAADGQVHHIAFLTLWDLMRARMNREYAGWLEQAALVLPVSMGIVRGAAFLKRPKPERYLPYDFVIRILGVLEERNRSVYLFGGTKNVLQISEKKLKQTFPGLRIVGRYSGRYRKTVEPDIIQAIRKASPSLLLAGNGIPGREKWLRKNRSKFNSGILLWGEDCFEIFAAKHGRISRAAFRRGMEFLPGLFRNPWRLFRGFVYLYYLALLLVYRLRKL